MLALNQLQTPLFHQSLAFFFFFFLIWPLIWHNRNGTRWKCDAFAKFCVPPRNGRRGVVVFVFLPSTLLGVICQCLLQNNMIYAGRLIVWPSLT